MITKKLNEVVKSKEILNRILNEVYWLYHCIFKKSKKNSKAWIIKNLQSILQFL